MKWVPHNRRQPLEIVGVYVLNSWYGIHIEITVFLFLSPVPKKIRPDIHNELNKMNTSPVSNILGCYFDVKKDKLQWKGTLEDLKAFILTEIDEETAVNTSWHSPGGGT